MSEQTVEVAPEAAEATTTEPEPFDAERATEKIRKANDEARSLRTRLKELETQQRASMSEADKAVAEAEERGRTAALTEFGQRLARSEFVAAAARRNPAWDASAVLDDLNLARYVGEDGEPDEKAIAKAVERLVPEPNGSVPNLDLGPKQTASGPPSMNSLIRQAAGRT